VPFRMEIQGSTGKAGVDLVCLSACDFFLFATIYSA